MAAKPTYEDLAEKIDVLEGEIRGLHRKQKELEASVVKFSALAEGSLAGIFILQDGYVDYLNPRFLEMTAYDHEKELLGRKFSELVHPEDRKLIDGSDLTGIKTEALPERFSFRVLKKNGSPIWLDMSIRIAPHLGPRAVIGSVTDRTDQRQVEEALRQSEEKYRTILDYVEDGYYEVDLKGNLVFFNDAYVRISAYSPEELMGMNYRDYTGEKDTKRVYQFFHQVCVTGRPSKFVAWDITRKDGAKRHMELSVSLIRDAEGRPSGFRGIARDITDRKRFEKELKRHQNQLEDIVRERTAELTQANRLLHHEIAERKRMEQKLLREKSFSDSVVDCLPGGFYVFDEAGKFLRWNEAFEELTGYAREEVVTMNALDFFDGIDKLRVGEKIIEAFIDGRSTVEAGMVSKDGNSTPTLFTGVRIALDGKVYLVGLGVDISERIMAEEALRESEKELRVLSRQMITAQEKERQRLAFELHDGIGQVLTAIKFSLENVIRRMETEVDRAAVAPLRDLIPMIQDAVEEIRRMSVDLRPTILDDLGILATVTWFCREFKRIHSYIHIEKEMELKEAEVPGHLKIVFFRILQEAMNNVAKHSGGDHVRVSLNRRDDLITLEISDNGRGFDLDRTLAVDSTRRGFGLASMRERAELSGGSYLIASDKGTGTRVCVEWSLADALCWSVDELFFDG